MSELIKVFTAKHYLNFNDKQSFEHPILINVCGKYSCENYSFKTQNHDGRKDYYLIYVTEGTLKVALDDKVVSLKKGNIVLFPPSFKYEYFAKPPLEYYYAHFTGSYVERLIKDCGFWPLPFIKKCDFSFQILNDFNKLLQIFNVSHSLKDQKCASIFQNILLSIFDNVEKSQEDFSIDNSLAYIYKNYNTKLEIPMLAEMENFSNSHYIALFRKKTGTSPNKYIINLRISVACDLLSNTDKPIKEIAEAVGYEDPYFFSSLFKKHVGVSPKDFRKTKFYR